MRLVGENPPSLHERTAADQLDAVREVLRAINRSPFDMDGVLAIVVERARDLCGSHYGYIFVPDREGFYRYAVGAGGTREQDEYERTHLTPVTQGTIVGRTVLANDAVQIDDAATDPAYTWREGQRLGGFRTVLGVPIRIEGRMLGVIAMGRLEVRPFGEDEIELVRTFADQAAMVIDNARLLGTIERQREELARYLPSTVARLVSSPDGEQLLAGHRREVSAVFCDLRGFTAFAEAAEPEDVLALVREYHVELGAIITAHQATLEHYAGDGLMMFINDPEPVADHPVEAAAMALEIRDRIGVLATRWRQQGFDLGVGIGISVGYASLGRVGFEGHYAYAVIGSVANLAARLCGIAEQGQIVVSERAFGRFDGRYAGTRLGSFELKGFRRPVEAWSLDGAA
jgi:class 3 adenylate cyclase